MKKKFNFRSYVTYITFRSSMWMFGIGIVVSILERLLTAFILIETYDVNSRYGEALLLGVLRAIPLLGVGAFAGFMSSICVIMIVAKYLTIDDRKQLISQITTLAMICLSFIFSFIGWYFAVMIIVHNPVMGAVLIFTTLSSMLIMSIHYFAFPHMFDTVQKRKEK